MTSGIGQTDGRLRVVQVSPFLDPEERGTEELLAAWPTLVYVAEALVREGIGD